MYEYVKTLHRFSVLNSWTQPIRLSVKYDTWELLDDNAFHNSSNMELGG